MPSRSYLAAAMLLVACGSEMSGEAGPRDSGGIPADGGAPTPEDGFLECPADVPFHLTGEVNGQAIDITEAPTLGGFRQSDAPPGSRFRLPNETDMVPDLVNIELTWEGVALSGEVTPVDGWVLMPPGGPLAGETVCAGPGSTMVIPPNEQEATRGEFLFILTELSLGSACDEPASGRLDGCWRN